MSSIQKDFSFFVKLADKAESQEISLYLERIFNYKVPDHYFCDAKFRFTPNINSGQGQISTFTQNNGSQYYEAIKREPGDPVWRVNKIFENIQEWRDYVNINFGYNSQINSQNKQEQNDLQRQSQQGSSLITGRTIRLSSPTIRIAASSRLIGNKASHKCSRTKINTNKICVSIIK